MAKSQKLKMTNLLLAIVGVLGAATFQSTEATDYEVGDSTGWQNNPSSNGFYSNWANNKTFTLGDNLIFTFATNSHDVAKVTEAAYNNCNTANPIFVIRNGPATIPLNETGDQYYICTFTNHCSSGQKLHVDVTSSTPSPPGSPPSPGTTNSTPPPPPPPPSSSSASCLGATIALMFMSIAMGFMCYF